MEVTTWVEALRYGPRTLRDTLDGHTTGNGRDDQGRSQVGRRFSDHAGRNASERRAGPENVIAKADPPQERGRPPTGREASDTSTGWFPPG